MTTWRFDGVLLPEGSRGRIELGEGEYDVLPGRFALPGLIDAHCHLTMGQDSLGLRLYGEELAFARLDEYARDVVTALRDVGGERSVTLALASGPPGEGRPVVLAAGRFLAPQGRYFPRAHEPVPAEELIAAVEAEIADGATWLKLVGDFPAVGPDGPIIGSKVEASYPIEVVAEMVATAHRHGARVAAHTNAEVVSDLVRVGVDSIEHGTVLGIEDLDLLGARGGAWTPTLCASVQGGPDESDDRRRRRLERTEHLRAMLPEAVRRGVRVLAGTDVVGSMAREIELLVELGLTVEQALAAATVEARDYLGVGASGDLVTYDEDPREVPATLHKPSAVVIRGHRVR